MKKEETEEFEDDFLPEIDNNFCLVCGKSPAATCYGSRACGSCKAFFLRISTINEAIPDCSFGGNCATTNFVSKGKEKCRACRYQKCLTSGMSPDVTARRKGCHLREKRSQITFQRGKRKDFKESPAQKEITDIKIDTREIQMIALINPSNQLPSTSSTNYLSVMVNLEKSLLNESDSIPNRFDFSFDLNHSVIDLLHNPTQICPRVPMGFGTNLPHDLSIKHIETMPARIFSRLNVQMADWFRNLPEIWALSEDERCLLFCQKGLAYFFLLLYYYSHKLNFNGLVHVFGNSIPLDDAEVLESVEDGYKFVIKYGFATIMPLFKRENVGDEEFVFLRNITIFSSAIGFTDSGAEVIRKAFVKYSHLLLEHLKEKMKNEMEAIRRFSELMTIPSFLMCTAQRMNPEFGHQILCNQGGVGTKLPYEIFKRA